MALLTGTAPPAACPRDPAASALIVASVLAMRSSKVFPQDAVAVALRAPVKAMPGVAADEPSVRFNSPSETPRTLAVKLECELPERDFMVPWAVTSPPKIPA